MCVCVCVYVRPSVRFSLFTFSLPVYLHVCLPPPLSVYFDSAVCLPPPLSTYFYSVTQSRKFPMEKLGQEIRIVCV